MPLLKFYVSKDQLTGDEKKDLAGALTGLYAKLMPAFFVVVVFHELPPQDLYVGGLPVQQNFIRLTLEHLALKFDQLEQGTKKAKEHLDSVGGILEERFGGRGWRWEYNITETDRDLWRIQNFEVPQVGSEEMKPWTEAQRGLPWVKKV